MARLVGMSLPRLGKEIIGYDDFTAADGTSPDRRVNSSYINTRYNTVWETHQRDPTGNWLIQTNRLYCTNARRLMMVSEPRIRNSESYVDIYCVTALTTSRRLGMVIRDPNDASNFAQYEISYLGPASTTPTVANIEINYIGPQSAGSRLLLESEAITALTAGQTGTLGVIAKNNCIEVLWNSNKLIRLSSSYYNGSGMIGLSSNTMSSTTGFHMDNFISERF